MMTTTFSKIQSVERKPGVSVDTAALRTYLNEKRKYFIFKRLFDIVLSSLVIIFLLSWLVPLVALLIRLDSSGPVFFIQKRVGRWGRSFNCFKFRTMVVNDQANTKQAAENDKRITRIGNFLRKSNLDEFPQFFNVLLGQMSIVGPRPHMHSDCNSFSSVVHNYKFRNTVKPGITGLAQVKGYRGPTKSFEDVFHRYQFDAFYIRNANFWLDMRIVRKTAAQTFKMLFGKLFASEVANEEVETPQKWTASFKSLN
ncbi:sugar transferase [Paraflavitalea sp. CAU 1676]|uniref:sugar transferase n=1 Tax=Paraflavitalea sp. CAU 1676 TaxID=3032598 RepID=UPI0023DB1B5A|nr:sugar transferase [Paraflavitalea sp. CAU 1676]MDF2187463.1 sugar transferase [Paraflavitalea sp. CAU 1676]